LTDLSEQEVAELGDLIKRISSFQEDRRT